MQEYFNYKHLPADLQKVSAPIGHVAKAFELAMPESAEKSAGMRKLLEAKDCFVRAALNNDTANELHIVLANTIAQVCHEINKAYCEALGDDSQPDWDNAPEWQKESAINGVLFHLANPDAGTDASHQSWYNEKADAGWVYGAVKDEVAKTHPCMVHYADLPVEQRAKDYLFRQVVHSLK